MHNNLEAAIFWIVAIVVVLTVTIGVTEWSRIRQQRENLKANGRRK